LGLFLLCKEDICEFCEIALDGNVANSVDPTGHGLGEANVARFGRIAALVRACYYFWNRIPDDLELTHRSVQVLLPFNLYL
jgi:hypothetical protein